MHRSRIHPSPSTISTIHPSFISFSIPLMLNLIIPVTEYYEHGSLWNYVRSGSPSKEILINIIIGTASGISHLHYEKLVHRDIAARNVLLSSTLQAKIADFGLSRVLESPTDTGHTVSMTGPLRHMAPESIRVQEYSPASDSWMWGVMMFETLTATVPYSDLSPLQAATEVVLGRRLELPEQIAKEWPLLIPLIRGCFATKPDDRPSMHTICQHLSRNFSRKQTM
eukprot:TRINITY_DN3304_c0_g2_i3.p1 TRINITY_DN3304_c0_g2~~TRINITY_DN3304_c0_g2_i3.p1  ORF type:complete len:225 (+),score=59.86 TRINITY_DN3304_c0_g2_i3:132-806(+)